MEPAGRRSGRNGESSAAQRGIRGNVIIYPQRPSAVATVLSPAVEDIVSYVCVVYVGSQKPTKEWLKEKAVPLCVRPDRVRCALRWLQAHNPLYAHVRIDEHVLAQDDVEQALDVRRRAAFGIRSAKSVELLERSGHPMHQCQ